MGRQRLPKVDHRWAVVIGGGELVINGGGWWVKGHNSKYYKRISVFWSINLQNSLKPILVG